MYLYVMVLNVDMLVYFLTVRYMAVHSYKLRVHYLEHFMLNTFVA
mgnify:FL=1